MNGLILHCGAHAVERAALARLPEPEPLGPRHCPIHHADFVDKLESTLDAAGYDIREQAYGLTHDGARLFGLMSVQHRALAAFDGGEFVVGFRGSHDQSLPRGIAAGSRVFVCDNLAFNGEIVMSTKQTTHIHDRLPVLLDDMVRKLGITFTWQVKQFDAYHATAVSPDMADRAIMEIGRRGVVNWSELGKVVAEWDNPSHDEHAEGGANVWRLFNATTEVLRIRNPEHPRLPMLAPKTAELHRICDVLADLPVAA